MNFLFNDKKDDDITIILTFINDFTKGAGYDLSSVSDEKIYALISRCRCDNFPHNDGYEQASAFKKLANFMVHFIAERPLPKPFPRALVGDGLSDIDNHQNAIIAFNLAIKALEGAVIHRQDGDVTLSNPIQLSKHSYTDIICALSRTSPTTGFQLVTVLLEQLAYKTNPYCQYRPLLAL